MAREHSILECSNCGRLNLIFAKECSECGSSKVCRIVASHLSDEQLEKLDKLYRKAMEKSNEEIN